MTRILITDVGKNLNANDDALHDIMESQTGVEFSKRSNDQQNLFFSCIHSVESAFWPLQKKNEDELHGVSCVLTHNCKKIMLNGGTRRKNYNRLLKSVSCQFN